MKRYKVYVRVRHFNFQGVDMGVKHTCMYVKGDNPNHANEVARKVLDMLDGDLRVSKVLSLDELK